MVEPTTTTAAGVAAAISGVTLALLGVDYYSLLYGLVGAMLALSQSSAMTRWRAVVHVGMSTIVGAVMGTGAVALFGSNSRALLIMGCLVCGAGAQVVVAAILKAILARIELMGGGAGLDGRLPNAPGGDDDEGGTRHGR